MTSSPITSRHRVVLADAQGPIKHVEGMPSMMLIGECARRMGHFCYAECVDGSWVLIDDHVADRMRADDHDIKTVCVVMDYERSPATLMTIG